MAACLARTVGPTLAGASWSFMADTGFIFPFFVYILLGALLVTLYAETLWIEKKGIAKNSVVA